MKKLFLILAVLIVAVTVVACAGENSPTPEASEITKIVPSAVTSETTETSEPALTTAQPEATEPASTAATEQTTGATTETTPVIEPTVAKKGYAANNRSYETDDKVFFDEDLFNADFMFNNFIGNMYSYYSKTDGQLHVFCDDPNCDHKNFDGENFTPKCAACLVYDPLIYSQLYYYNVAFCNSRVYIANFGELFSADLNGGDVRLEVSLYPERAAYDRMKGTGRDGGRIYATDRVIGELTTNGKYIYIETHDESAGSPVYRFDTETKELVSVDEKMAALGEKVGSLLYFSVRADGTVYARKYKPNYDASDWRIGDKIYEDGYYVVTGDFEDLALIDDKYLPIISFVTDEGTILTEFHDDQCDLVLQKNNGERETIIENVYDTFGDSVQPLYIDNDYLYYTYWASLGKDLNLDKLLKLPQYYRNQSYGKLMRYSLKGGAATDATEYVVGYTKKSNEKTAIKDANGTVCGYYELYDVTVGTAPYYVTRLDENGKFVDLMKSDPTRVAENVRGYRYYPVDTSKTVLKELIDKATMKQAVDDGKSYNDFSVYYVDPTTKFVYLIYGDAKVVYDTTKLISNKPTFGEFENSIPANDIVYRTTAVIDDIMMDKFNILYIDHERGKVLVETEKYVLSKYTMDSGKVEKNVIGTSYLALFDIDGAGYLVNFTPLMADRADDELKRIENERGAAVEGYAGDGSPLYKRIETDNVVIIYGSYSTSSDATGAMDIMYYDKITGRLYPLCADPSCDHVIFDGNTVTPKCAYGMLRDINNVYAYYSGPSGNVNLPVYVNSRLYFAFFQEIYSCDERGSGLRLEYSFDKERGVYENIGIFDPSTCEIERIRVSNLKADGDYLYFKYTDKNGKTNQYRFHTFTKELENVTEKIYRLCSDNGVLAEFYDVLEGKIVVQKYHLTNDPSDQSETKERENVFYEIDPDFKILSDSTMNGVDIVFVTDDGYIFNERNGNSPTRLVKMTDDGKTEVIVDDVGQKLGEAVMLYIDDNFIYYCKNENLGFGNSLGVSTGLKNTYGGKIYRYDIKTGESKVVLNDITLGKFSVVYKSDKNKTAVVLATQYYKKNNDVAGKVRLFKFDIDEKGDFVNMSMLEG